MSLRERRGNRENALGRGAGVDDGRRRSNRRGGLEVDIQAPGIGGGDGSSRGENLGLDGTPPLGLDDVDLVYEMDVRENGIEGSKILTGRTIPAAARPATRLPLP